jgi:hypothetical protein
MCWDEQLLIEWIWLSHAMDPLELTLPETDARAAAAIVRSLFRCFAQENGHSKWGASKNPDWYVPLRVKTLKVKPRAPAGVRQRLGAR